MVKLFVLNATLDCISMTNNKITNNNCHPSRSKVHNRPAHRDMIKAGRNLNDLFV